jgi:hypothetical protein
VSKSLSLLLVAAVCVALFVSPSSARAEEFNYAKRVALGLQGGSFLFGPTIEYWPSDNLDLSVKVGGWFGYTNLVFRGTYLFNNQIHIFGDYSARPYAGAGLGYQSWSVLGYPGFGGGGLEVFGGLMQPLSKNWTLRGELDLQYYAVSYPYGYGGSTSGNFGVDAGIFYHFGQ